MTIKMLGWEDQRTVFYANGHHDAETFLVFALEAARKELTEVDEDYFVGQHVKHIWFKPMGPTAAKNRGWDWGVTKTKAPAQGEETRGRYPVTAIFL